jgi:hypothetical protein
VEGPSIDHVKSGPTPQRDEAARELLVPGQHEAHKHPDREKREADPIVDIGTAELDSFPKNE